MNKVYNTFSLIFLYASFFANIQAQPLEIADSIFYQQSLASAIGLYEKAVGVNSPLYKGKEYVDYKIRITGFQYFQSELWEKGSVIYEGLPYSDVKMKYDIANEVLVVDHAQLSFPIKLESEKIDQFALLDHDFIRLEEDTSANAGIETGFYDLLYDGNVQFLIKRIKFLKDEIENQQMHYWFEEADRYYIHKDDAYYRVKSKGSVLKVFPDYKREIQKYLKNNKIKFRKMREEAIYQLVMFYDQQIDGK